jgi:hypothetical protein
MSAFDDPKFIAPCSTAWLRAFILDPGRRIVFGNEGVEKLPGICAAKGANDVVAPLPPPQIGPSELGAPHDATTKKTAPPPASQPSIPDKKSPTMTMEEIRRAVEKRNGKTALPAAGVAPAPPDKEKKDRPQ